MESLEEPPLVRAIRSIFYRRLVENHTRPHGGTEGDFFQVYALGGSGLGLGQVSQHGLEANAFLSNAATIFSACSLGTTRSSRP